MIEYIKMIILAVITGLTAPLPTSSAAHFNFFSSVIGLSGDSERTAFYYNAFMLVFSLVILVTFRKAVVSAFRLALSSKPAKEKANIKDTKFFVKNILASLVPTLILFVPVSKGKLLMDFLDTFMNVNGLILAGFACVIVTCILIIALWYTSKSDNPLKKGIDPKSALRLSFYQLPCYIIPGFSHIASGAVNLFISDISAKSLVSQLYIYIGPSMFFVSIVRIIRSLFSGIIYDPVALVLGAVFFAVAARCIISLTTKVNIRRLFGFFCAYSLLFGVFVAVASFYI